MRFFKKTVVQQPVMLSNGHPLMFRQTRVPGLGAMHAERTYVICELCSAIRMKRAGVSEISQAEFLELTGTK